MGEGDAAPREAVLKITRQWIDTPYRHQASKRGVGTDCLGLIRGIWRSLYGTGDPEGMPNYTPACAASWQRAPRSPATCCFFA